MQRSTESAKRAMRSGGWPDSARPLRQRSATDCASASGVLPWRAAEAGSIHGANDAASSAGKVSSRLPRSPFGSIAITGMPSIAASSSSVTASPVLPLPVMPTITAWVQRSFAS
jgi:hypothetical protein